MYPFSGVLPSPQVNLREFDSRNPFCDECICFRNCRHLRSNKQPIHLKKGELLCMGK